MNCPKCMGQTFLSEEELVQVLENSDPIKVVVKAIFQCRACNERFTRILYDDLAARRKEPDALIQTPTSVATTPSPYQYPQQTQSTETTQTQSAPEGIKFF